MPVAKVQPQRRFIIPTQPCAADPAWVIAAYEIIDGASEPVVLSNYDEIKTVIADCERKHIEDCARMKEFDRILTMFGCKSVPEFWALADKCKAERAHVTS